MDEDMSGNVDAPGVPFVLEFTVFSWALEIKMLECQGIRARNAPISRVNGAQNAGIYSIFVAMTMTGEDKVKPFQDGD